MKIKQPQGMTAFTLVWFGQVISMVGSAMSGFAMTIWAWQITGQATALALVGFFNFAPAVLFGPFAGALVDRWNKKLVMMLSDLAAGVATIIMLILYQAGQLQIWHLYILGAFSGVFQAFQWPAYSSAISVMIPKEHYARASGMMSFAEWGSGIFAPVLAGALIGVIGLQGILLIDIITFIFAISMLLVIFIPPVPRSSEGQAASGSLLKEAMFGFKYILAKPGLLGLQLVFFFGNFMATLAGMLVSPMVLARTGNSAQILGIVQSVGSAGGILGSLAITAWGGPKRKVNGVIFGWIFEGIFGTAMIGLLGTLPFWLIGSFFASFTGPVINASNQAIWQSKVPPDIQGKVFSVRRMIAQVIAPLAMLITGPLADRVFEPAMRAGTGPLASFFAPITGTGVGAGMSAIMVIAGAGVVVTSLISYLNPLVRNVETMLPDHDQVPPATVPATD